jgi:hypothetical protein
MVEWMSALEGTVQKICRHAAGIEDEPAPAPAAREKKAAAAASSEWVKQLERNFDSFDLRSTAPVPAPRPDHRSDRSDRSDHRAGGSSSSRTSQQQQHGSSGGAGNGAPAMINIIGYEPEGPRGGGGNGAPASSSGYGRDGGYGSGGYGSGGYGSGGLGPQGSGGLGYGQIAGAPRAGGSWDGWRPAWVPGAHPRFQHSALPPRTPDAACDLANRRGGKRG